MSKAQRVKSFITGVIVLLAIVLIVALPEEGFWIIAAVLGAGLIVRGVRTLIYYFTMARYMVGGKSSLCVGILLLDLGVFTLSLLDVARTYVVLYLLAVNVFAGAVDVLRAVDAKRLGTRVWKWKLFHGVLELAVAVAAVIGGFVLHANTVVVIVYSIGLFFFACERIAAAFRRTEIVYIA